MAYYDGELVKENFAKRLNQVDGIMITVSDASVLLSLSMYETPISDVVEVKHGHWIYKKTYYTADECNCSLCGQLMTTAHDKRMSYCPQCGAKMDEGSNQSG